MSRGLGRRQSLILRALAQLEQEEGTGRFYVWAVLKAAWALGLRQEEADQQAARAAEDARWLADVRALAASGDPQAAEQLRREGHRAMLAGALRRRASPRQRRPAGSYIVEDVNPSRCFALLARRGLVERNGQLGPGAAVGLTETGRAEVVRLQKDGRVSGQLVQKPSPPSAGAPP